MAEPERANPRSMDRARTTAQEPLPVSVRVQLRPVKNPYVGPVAFEREDGPLFFGRDREAESLVSLIISKGVVLFYAQSGAGKTSLINARLIPQLEARGFEVLPVARVGGEIAAGMSPENVYVFNALSYLSGLSQEDWSDLEDKSLQAFLERDLAGEEEEIPPRLLVLDQFEEILTSHPERREDREGFFRQLRQALAADPLLSVVFVIREDHIAGLDRFASLLPGRLRARLRMERLRYEDAITAIRRPAEEAGRPFAENVAEALADNLRQERVAGEQRTIAGEFVEPVQLQVVCVQLWENLRDRPGQEITRTDVDAFGDVNRALESFYEAAVEHVTRRTEVPEAQLRRWFGATLITPSRIRSQVDREPDGTGGLPNEAIDRLVDEHLIRAEKVRGGSWYELVHDRFIEPILASNERWIPEHVPLAAAARKAEQAGYDPSFLYRDKQLDEAREWAKANPTLVTDLERRFLQESGALQRDQDKARAVRRFWLLASALGVLLLVVVGLLAVLVQFQIANARQRIITALKDLDSDPQQSLRTALKAADMFLAAPAITPELEPLLREGLHAFRKRPIWARQSEPISTFAWSTDGRRLVTADENGDMRVWDAESGEVLLCLPREIPDIVLLAANREATRLAIFDWHGGAQIRGTAPPEELRLSEAPGQVNAASFSPDGNYLATGYEDAPLRLWDPVTGSLVAMPGNDTEVLYSLTFSPDSQSLATAGADGTVRLWDVTSLSEGRLNESTTLPAHSAAVNAVVFSPDGVRVASASDDKTARLWNRETSERRIFRHDGKVLDVVFSRDGDYLVTVTLDRTGRVWNLHRPSEVMRFRIQEEYALAPGGRLLAQSGADGFEALELLPEDVPTLTGHEDSVLAVCFDRGGQRLATAGADSTVRVWDAQSTTLLRTLPGHEARINAVAFNVEGTFVAGAGDDRTARIWDASSGKELHTLPGHGDAVTGVVFSPDGHLVTAGRDRQVRVWDAGSGQPLREWSTGSPIHAVAISPDGRFLATAQGDGTAVTWHLDSGRQERSFAGHGNSVTAVAFGPRGDRLATGSADHTVKIWDRRSGEPPLTIDSHSKAVQAVAFSSDGLRLATADLDEVLLWAADSGEQLSTLPDRREPVRAVAFSPDGSRLASAGDDGMVRLDPARLQDLIEMAERRSEPGGDGSFMGNDQK
ncbi:MAG: hypothetical protein GY856_52705 [bacterium]|nr:hypothetical protein [bacterium]